MHANTRRSPAGESQRPDLPKPPGTLTDAQRNFARVVGQVLADAWRRRFQHDGGGKFLPASEDRRQ